MTDWLDEAAVQRATSAYAVALGARGRYYEKVLFDDMRVALRAGTEALRAENARLREAAEQAREALAGVVVDRTPVDGGPGRIARAEAILDAALGVKP